MIYFDPMREQEEGGKMDTPIFCCIAIQQNAKGLYTSTHDQMMQIIALLSKS